MDPHKFKAGVKHRIIAYEAGVATGGKLKPSLLRRRSFTLSSAVLYDPRLVFPQDNIDEQFRQFCFYIHLSFAYRRYADKLKYLSGLKQEHYSTLLRHVAYADDFIDCNGELAKTISASDYSLFCRPSDGLLSVELASHMRTCFSKFLKRLRLPHSSLASIMKAYDTLARRGDSNAQPPELTISAIRSALRKYGRTLWPLTGSYVLHNLSRLFDPEDTLTTQQYLGLEREVFATMLEDLFIYIIAIRYLNSYTVDLDFLKTYYSKILDTFPGDLGRKWALYHDGSFEEALSIKVNSRDKIAKIIEFTINIYCNVKLKRKLEIVFREIEKLYCIDAAATHFLNWPPILQYIGHFRASTDPRSIFVSITLSSNAVISRRFPFEVALVVGAGRAHRQIFNKATEYVRERKARTVSFFLRKFLKLAGPSKDLVFTHLADKSVADRLYSIFHPVDFDTDFESTDRTSETSAISPADALRTGEKQLDPKPTNRKKLGEAEAETNTSTERKVSELRIEILKFLRDKSTGEKPEIQRLINEESAVLRSLYFKEIYGLGRINFSDIDLFFEVEGILEQEFNFINFSAPQDLRSDDLEHFYQQFSTVVSDKIIQHAVFNSDFSIDSILSNNLRHGVIEPRILHALDAAARNAGDIEIIGNLRDQISWHIQEFMRDWLKVSEDGETIQSLNGIIPKRIRALLEGKIHVSGSDVAEVAVEELRNAVERIGASAGSALETVLRPAVTKVCAEICEEHSVSVAMHERLMRVLSEAITDVKSWLAVSNFQGEIESFSVSDLARFEINVFQPLHYTSNFDGVTVEERQANGDFRSSHKSVRFEGYFFEPILTIIHNTVSNSFKYSGNGSHTDVRLRVRIDGDDLTFRVENDLHPSLSETELSTLVGRAREAANADPTKDAFKEGGSGFKKIRRVCAREFGGCKINIPTVGKRRVFVCEVIIPDAVGSYEIRE